jgi:hypothetical protein
LRAAKGSDKALRLLLNAWNNDKISVYIVVAAIDSIDAVKVLHLLLVD